jgi:serine/threonine protein kinase
MVAKVLRPDLVEEEYALRGLRRELEALEALAHPVLLRVVAAHVERPYPHLLVEHLDGPTLRRLIRKSGPLPAEQARRLGLHVAAGIQHMAQKGWVHLDVKPDNLVMGSSARVIDLSLARTIERARRLTDYIGTNAYMSPEQCRPRLDVGPPADVWGLGATLYHALAGRPPFRRPRTRDNGAALEDRYPQLEDEPYPWRRPVPEALSDAILSCLRKEPTERPTAAELASMLQALRASDRDRRRVSPRPAWHSQRR